ncbi:hypothetical protein L9F63_012613, partial [Diploptera punctata]
KWQIYKFCDCIFFVTLNKHNFVFKSLLQCIWGLKRRTPDSFLVLTTNFIFLVCLSSLGYVDHNIFSYYYIIVMILMPMIITLSF